MGYEKDKEIFSSVDGESVVTESNSIEKEFSQYEEYVFSKLYNYLNRTNCTEEDIKEIYDDYDVISNYSFNDFNFENLAKIEKFVDNSNDKALYNISYIKEFIGDIASKCSEYGTKNSSIIKKENDNDFEDLEDEDIADVTERNKKGIINWFKDNFIKKEKKDKKTSTIGTLFKKIFTKKNDNELENEDIEEVTERNKKGIINWFKGKFNKKEGNKDLINPKKDLINPKNEVIKKFFAENKLDTIPEVVSLYNEIIMSDEGIDKLYDYIAKNVEEAKNVDNIISKMNEILGKKMIEKRKDNKVSAEENLNKIEKIRKEIERLEKNKEEIKNIKFISADEDEKAFVKEEPKVVSNIAKEETIKYYDDQIKKLRDQIKEIIANNKYTNENGREISMEERARFDRLDEVQIQIIETMKEQKKINSEFNEAWYGHMGEKVDTELLKRRMILKNKLDTINIKLNLLKQKRDEIINENPLAHPRTM